MFSFRITVRNFVLKQTFGKSIFNSTENTFVKNIVELCSPPFMEIISVLVLAANKISGFFLVRPMRALLVIKTLVAKI